MRAPVPHGYDEFTRGLSPKRPPNADGFFALIIYIRLDQRTELLYDKLSFDST